MKSTLDLIAAYTSAHGGSANKASRHINVSAPVYAEWASGKELPSEERVAEMARALKADEQLALVLLRRDRAKTDSVRRLWSKIADALAATLVFTVGVAMLSSSPNAQAATSHNQFADDHSRAKALIEYTLQNLRRWLGLDRLAGAL